jgi:hypothetical protein
MREQVVAPIEWQFPLTIFGNLLIGERLLCTIVSPDVRYGLMLRNSNTVVPVTVRALEGLYFEQHQSPLL